MVRSFPIIEHFDDVKQHITDDFYVTEKSGYKVINYKFNKEDTFDNDIKREFRGLIFYEDGTLACRRFHKFFNVGERETTRPENINWEQRFDVFEKLDGSMISPLKIKGGYRLTTKMGITDVALVCEKWLHKDPERYQKYVKFFDMFGRYDWQPIFEWCSRKQRIVLDYPEDQLILTAVRHKRTGMYYPYDDMVRKAKHFGISYVDIVASSNDSYETIAQGIRSSEDSEGAVIRFEDGEMVKIKSEWYVTTHRAKEQVSREKDLIKLILTNQLDDLKPLLDAETLSVVNDYQYQVITKINNIAKDVEAYMETHKSQYDRKTFALTLRSNIKDTSIHKFYYGAFDGREPVAMIEEFVLQKCSRQSMVDSIRSIIGPKIKTGKIYLEQ